MSFVARSVVRGLTVASAWTPGPLKRALEPASAADTAGFPLAERAAWGHPDAAPAPNPWAHAWPNANPNANPHANPHAWPAPAAAPAASNEGPEWVHSESQSNDSQEGQGSSDWTPAASHSFQSAADHWKFAASVGQGGPHWSYPTTEGSISPQARNGGSPYGSFNATTMPSQLGDAPWGDTPATSFPTMPDTGVTRTYDFTLSYDNISPDGVQKLGLLINGQYPGPTIEANWGDWIEVTVHNQLTNEGTALHWHGLLQKETQWMDGVPGVAQCPIPPGQSFTYRFRADLFGTSWYHSHYSAQYVGGSVGPMVIYGPRTEDYDIDLGPIMLNDWYHSAYYPLVEQTMAPASENQPIVQSDNILISGHGTFDCSKTTLPCVPNAGLAKFQFQSGKTHRLRLMNTGAESILKFSIDEHTMTVIANDYVPLNPYNTTAVTLGVGQRTDVLVTADLDSTSAVFMRANAGPGLAAGGCNSNNPEASQAMAVIYYEDANTTVIPTSSPQSDAELTYCGNDDLSLTTPLQELAPVTDAATTQEVHISYRSNGTHNLFYMGEETYRADYNDAILLSANQGDLQFPAQSNVYDFGSNATVNLVVYNHFPAEHPMHMHGHNYWVLAEGTGRWNGRITNPHNPQRRDVQILQPGSQHGPPSYIVVQITQDNPGIWPFHCHIAWHVSGGLYMNLLERKEDITGLKIPGQMAQTCSDWADYTNSMAPDQIDSGL